jgi:hypothetical protein
MTAAVREGAKSKPNGSSWTMDPAVRQLVEAIHQTGGKTVLAVTGGGTGAAALLLGIPGGSRTILEVITPYHEQALVQFLGHRPLQFCSAATSRELAIRAYERASWLAPGVEVLGVGCTASLASDRPKCGDHRFHLSWYMADHSTTYSLTLAKAERQGPGSQREAEEAVLDAALLNALAEAFGLAERVPVPLLADEAMQREARPETDLVSSLLRGELPAIHVGVDGAMSLLPSRASFGLVLLPGAFNPVHQGHWKLAEVASRLLRSPVTFELSVANVDKPTLPAAEIRRRLQQFIWHRPVWVTRAPTFVEKAALFPGAVFIVGADTAERIIAPRYYGNSETHMAQALESIRRQGCRFLVAGRTMDGKDSAEVARAGKHVALEDLAITKPYRDLFSGIPREDFDVSISSTAVREQADKGGT